MRNPFSQIHPRVLGKFDIATIMRVDILRCFGKAERALAMPKAIQVVCVVALPKLSETISDIQFLDYEICVHI